MNINDTTATATPGYSYPSVATLVADQANFLLGVFGSGIRPESAVDQVACGLVVRANEARTRTGAWAYETTTEKVDEALFYGAVARDILDGKAARPSTGNVRAYTLALVADLAN